MSEIGESIRNLTGRTSEVSLVEYERYAMEKLTDVLDGTVLAHFTKPNKIKNILKRGILSQGFSHRSGVRIARSRISEHKWVYFQHSAWDKSAYGDVAFLINRPADTKYVVDMPVVPNRVAPRDLIGVVVTYDDFDHVLKYASMWSDNKSNALPIYQVGTGDLL